ncbi:MAG: alpha/beta fold hydrolase [Reyranellales bacterium]
MRRIALVLIAAALAACAPAAPPTPSSPASAPLGIVLMHGKKGPPGYLAATKAILEAHGYLVSTPEMCWSDKRQYDRLYPDCLAEIDAAVADLRRRGARSIVIAGHSLGGTAAIAYGASHDDLAGVIGFAAGDAFWGPASLLPDIARAQQLVDQGRGDSVADFEDIRPSGRTSMRTTAAHFLSFVALPVEQRLPANVARLRVPLLLVAGTQDGATMQYEARAYDRVPNLALNRYVEVNADHNGTLKAGMKPALEWLARLVRGS